MATKYLNRDSGNNSNDGNSSGAAYATLAYALAALGTGDTLYIAASTGDYTWGSATIPNGVTIIGSVTPNPVTGEYVRISAGGAPSVWTLAGSFAAQKVWFYNSHITYGSQFPFDRSFTGNRVVTFTDCILSNMSTHQSTGSRGGIIAGGTSVGVYAAASTTVTLRRCAFFNLTSAPDASGGSIVRAIVSWPITFENCTYYSSASDTPAFAALSSYYVGTPPVVTYKNMVIQNDSGANLVPLGSGTGLAISNGCTLTGSVYTNIVTTSVTITASDNADPLMLDPANSDFRLKPASPAIDRGVAV